MKAGLFVAVGALATVAGGRTVDDLAGMADRAPVVSAAFAALAFALVGVPPAVGFAGKWHIVLGAVEAGRWLVAGVAVVSTLLTLAYFARVVERLYFRDAPAPTDLADRPDAAAAADPDADAALTADGSGSAGAGADGTAVPTVTTRARVIVVAAAVAAVVLGVFATDLIALFEPVVEVSFQ
jgi:multicomponent Na+:H+ antiporter subunit D